MNVVFFAEPLSDGVVLTLLPKVDVNGGTLTVVFQVPNGESIRLTASAVDIILEPGNAKRRVDIGSFRTGSRARRVPVQEFSPNDELRGTDRYGAFKPPDGPHDRFTADLDIGFGQSEAFSIKFPPIEVNGKLIQISSIRFSRTSEYHVPCVQ